MLVFVRVCGATNEFLIARLIWRFTLSRVFNKTLKVKLVF